MGAIFFVELYFLVIMLGAESFLIVISKHDSASLLRTVPFSQKGALKESHCHGKQNSPWTGKR
eukprot:7580280-Ditylum_brightwellii.AAC.1